MTDKIEQLTKCIDLMQHDVAEFEAKYQGRFAEEPHVGLGNRKTRCVNEATLPIITCHPSCLEKRDETREGTPARIPYIGKPVKKRKCWRPERKR